MFQKPMKQHIAEEAQLLAEEKWIIEALKKIKKQRNSLQIERLHLDSMKARIKSDASETSENVQKIQECATNDVVHREMEEEGLCNEEELNLTVTNSMFGTNDNNQSNNVEEEEEEEDLLIDMDLFMNTNNEQSQSQ